MRNFILFGFIWMTFPLIAQQQIILPRDETKLDASLAAFVVDLRKAIAGQEDNWLISVLDEEVISSFGDEPGIPSFLQYWAPENNETSFWPYLHRVVELGGVFLNDTADHSGKYQFVFPYVYDTDVSDDDDYYLLGVVTGKNVNLRKSPDAQSEVITQLSYNLIYYNWEPESDALVASGKNPYGNAMWYFVKTRDKKHEGWINWSYVYPVGGPRLFLYKNADDEWKISAFVAGD